MKLENLSTAELKDMVLDLQVFFDSGFNYSADIQKQTGFCDEICDDILDSINLLRELEL